MSRFRSAELNLIPESLLHFFSEHYQRINIARLMHLQSLEIDFSGKNVLDLGAGIGDHSLFYLMSGCEVTAFEGRHQLVEFIKYRLGIEACVCDFEKDLILLKERRNFDILHCYGLLYHLSNPAEFLKVVSKAGRMMLLETVVAPTNTQIGPNIIEEDKHNSTQAVSGFGCRPHREWLFEEMKANFPYVYIPLTQPKHPQFPNDWGKKNETHSRAVFIGSHEPLNSVQLTTELLMVQN